MYGYAYNIFKRFLGVTINPVVQAFVDANSIVDQTEINALNKMYVDLNTLVDAHGGTILYLNGISPTSYSAAKNAIIYGSGNYTMVEIGGAFTYTSNGILFSGSQCANIGTVIPNLAQERILVCHQRYSAISLTGISSGFSFASGTELIQLSARPVSSNSGYNAPTNYTAYDFSGAGNWIGYNNSTTYGLWKEGTFIPPSSTTSPSASLVGTHDYYIGARNINGSAGNFSGERLSTHLIIDDGGSRFSTSQIAQISNIVSLYNLTVWLEE